LHGIERNNDLEIGKIGIVLLVETALGVENAFKIASTNLCTDRPRTLAFGAADYALDMGITLDKYGTEIDFPRARIAVACRAAQLPAPIDTPFMNDFNDMEALKNDIRRAKSLGFGGKLCIHPKQIDLCNKLFSPTTAEIEFAAKVVAAFEKAEKQGQGVFQLDGKMVDYPVIRRSSEVLKLSEKIGLLPKNN
jgi:citrate lyase subunit beta/citryl-CoA lyase